MGQGGQIDSLEDLTHQMNIEFYKYLGFLLLLILFALMFDKLLSKMFKLERRKNVHGYYKRNFVNRYHYVATTLLGMTFSILIAYLGIKDFIKIEVLILIGINYFALAFIDIFMHWKYPVQKNEYRKYMISYVVIFLVTFLIGKMFLIENIV